MGRAYPGSRGVAKGESDMHLHGTKRDRSECVVCCFPLYKLIFFLLRTYPPLFVTIYIYSLYNGKQHITYSLRSLSVQ